MVARDLIYPPTIEDDGKHESQNQCQRQNKKIDISIDIRQQNNYFINGDTQVVAQVSARASQHLFRIFLSLKS
jgi:predicted GNAT family acetyltransferase